MRPAPAGRGDQLPQTSRGRSSAAGRPASCRAASPRELLLLAADLVDRALGVGHDEERAVRAFLEVRGDAEVLAEEQRLALGDLVLAEVVGDAVLQALVVGDVDLLAVVVDLQPEQVAAAKGTAGRADEEVALVVLAELLGGEEIDPARGDLVLPRQ